MPSRYLRTSEIAKAVGVHPNTVRLYEEWGFLPPIPRSPSGYRQYTEHHQDLMRLAWTALKWPFPGGKAPVIDLIHKACADNLGGALELAYLYLAKVRTEQVQAEAAVEFLERWAQGNVTDVSAAPLNIGQVAHRLGVTRDQLRNWERNGLLSVPRDPHSGYRLYGALEIGRVRVIRMLLQAGYSLMAILRMLLTFDQGQTHNLRQMLDTPRPDEDVYSVADRWQSTLAAQERRASSVIALLGEMITKPQQR
ncbi:MAG: MerR family DNA-binding transcriptional regulator [Chloroflexi bacterium]|nr:MerR family DNA-binding transcriptional regulator [Chloroflexota bacterium]